MTTDPTVLTKVDELLAAIKGYADPRRAAAEWKQVYKLLEKAGLPTAGITGIVGMRDVARLTEAIGILHNPAAAPAGEEIDPDVCRAAMKAFKKRSALARLDEESRLGRSPLSKGAVPHAAAITLPDEFPQAVWDELLRQGRIRCIGHGMYEVTPEPA